METLCETNAQSVWLALNALTISYTEDKKYATCCVFVYIFLPL